MTLPTDKPEYLFNFGYLNLDKLLRLQQKPAPFTPGEQLFWNDPHIAQQMLAAHLSQNTDAASRNKETIAQTVDWLVDYLQLKIGQTVLDLGCGPGLYATRLAQQGLMVTGVDYSQNSIEYATRAGLRVDSLWNDLQGTPFSEGGDWSGVVAQKPF